MTDISAASVKALRELTTLPLMDCKQALTEAGGDQDKAIEILKSKFKKVMLKRADNATSEGKIVVEMKADGSEAVMIELQCESAPVAGAESFLSLARQCALQLLNGPGADSPEALLTQPAPEAPGRTLNNLYEDVVNSIREKIVLSRIVRVAGPVGGYVHLGLGGQGNAQVWPELVDGDADELPGLPAEHPQESPVGRKLGESRLGSQANLARHRETVDTELGDFAGVGGDRKNEWPERVIHHLDGVSVKGDMANHGKGV